jgi:membrane associated rhomboid family serine protease
LYFPQNEQAGIWQFFTHMFMHSGIFHLLMNMFGLWMFGTPLAQRWGKKRFLVFYFIVGIGAAIIYTGVNYYQFDVIYNQLVSVGLHADEIQSMLDKGLYQPSLISEEKFGEFYQIMHSRTVGASGAIYGILVAFSMMFPNAKLMFIFLPFPIAAKYFIPALISLDLFLGFTGFSIFGASISIAHFAHGGGALVGFLVFLIWRKTRLRSP